MADLIKPKIDYSYAGFQQEQQDFPFPGTQLDNDLANLATSVDDIIDILNTTTKAAAEIQNARDEVVAIAASLSPTTPYSFTVVLGATSVLIPGGYQPGKVAEVLLNGVRISGWSAENGNTVTFSAITNDDLAGETAAEMLVLVGLPTTGFGGLNDRFALQANTFFTADGNLGLSQTRRYIDGILSGAVYDTSKVNYAGDAPNVLFIRYVKHTKPLTGVGRVFGALAQILSVANNHEFASTSDLEDKVAQTALVDFVGHKSAYARFATAAGTKASGWAGYDEMHDRTGLPSAASGGPLRGREITMIAGGIDNGGDDGLGYRYGLDVVHSKSPFYAGTDTQFAIGVRVINAARYSAAFGRTVIGTAFDAHGEDPYGTGSAIQIGFRGWVNSIGVLIDGNPVNGAFVAEIYGSTSIMKLGMKAINNSAGQIQFTSQNNAGEQKKAFSMDGGLSDPTTGAEDGRFSMRVLVNGTDTEAVALFPQADPLNPFNCVLNGAMRRLTVDGSGFVKIL